MKQSLVGLPFQCRYLPHHPSHIGQRIDIKEARPILFSHIQNDTGHPSILLIALLSKLVIGKEIKKAKPQKSMQLALGVLVGKQFTLFGNAKITTQ